MTPEQVSHAGGWDQYEVAFAKVDTTTGIPQDIVHFGGHGRDDLADMHTSSDNTRVAAAGTFSGNLTVGSTVLTTVAGGVHSGQGPRDGFIINLDANLAPQWAKVWPASTEGATHRYGSKCSGIEYDDSNNLIGVGYQCNATCVGVMTKMAAAEVPRDPRPTKPSQVPGRAAASGPYLHSAPGSECPRQSPRSGLRRRPPSKEHPWCCRV